MLRRAPQGDLAQGDQVALAEKALRRALGLLGHIDLARAQAGNQLVGCGIDQHHLVSVVQNGVGHRFVNAHAGDSPHRAVQALQVLHIECGPHVDASGQQLLHVLPALGVAGTLHVGVREFIHQQDGGLAGQGCVQVKLGKAPAPVRHPLQGQRFQAVQQRRSLRTAMGFHHADQDVAPRAPFALGGTQHGPGLANPGIGAKVDAQLAPLGLRLLGAQLRNQGVGVGALDVSHASTSIGAR